MFSFIFLVFPLYSLLFFLKFHHRLPIYISILQNSSFLHLFLSPLNLFIFLVSHLLYRLLLFSEVSPPSANLYFILQNSSLLHPFLFSSQCLFHHSGFSFSSSSVVFPNPRRRHTTMQTVKHTHAHISISHHSLQRSQHTQHRPTSPPAPPSCSSLISTLNSRQRPILFCSSTPTFSSLPTSHSTIS